MTSPGISFASTGLPRGTEVAAAVTVAPSTWGGTAELF